MNYQVAYLEALAADLIKAGCSNIYIKNVLQQEQSKFETQGDKYIISQSKLEKAKVSFWDFLQCLKIGSDEYSFLDLSQNWEKLVVSNFEEIINSFEYDRGIFNLTPRLGKTTLITELGGAFCLGQKKFKLAIVNANFDKVNEINTKIKQIINTEIYQEIFQVKDIAPKNATRKIRLSNGSIATFKVSGSNVIGSGYNGIIFDDFLNPNNEKSFARKEQAKINLSAFLSRKEYKKEQNGLFRNTKIIVVEQRVSLDDTTAICKSKWDEFKIPYKHLTLPFYFEKQTQIQNFIFEEKSYVDVKFNDKVKNEIIAERGIETFNTQYQQNPVASADCILKPHDLENIYNGNPQEMAISEYFEYIVMSLDTAAKKNKTNDSTAITLAGLKNGEIYILDVITIKEEFNEIRAAIEHLQDTWKPDYILIEDASTGTALISHFKNHYFTDKKTGAKIKITPIALNPHSKSKIDRLKSCLHFFHNKRIKIPAFAEWLPEWKMELLKFPYVNHDDRVDSLSQLLNWKNNQQDFQLY